MNDVEKYLSDLARLAETLVRERRKLNNLVVKALEQGKSLKEGEAFAQSLVVSKLLVEIADMREKIHIMP